MPEIIADTYEVIRKLGSGGGGVVYLAKHLRLNKQVVLKADKRKLSTSPTLLRREVDVLKDLNHPNIPRVYDFFLDEQAGVVYTVMDYIEGESLDKPLERGTVFSQAQVIEWAKQVLDALRYLHQPTHGTPPRGFVHSDIKPANLMVRPDGSICLIDFNIALAIGEQNVVGISAGYASPEHYGLDYSAIPDVEPGKATVVLDQGTAPLTERLTTPLKKATTGTTKLIVPDARSDIYSLGATLYHLLSGRRPENNAMDVVPLSDKRFSPPLAEIVNRAMAPNPTLRFQTAGEMLAQLENLHRDDPRARALRHSKRIAAAVLAGVMLLGCGMSFVGLKQMERFQAQQATQARAAEEEERQAKEALTAVRASESAYEKGNIPAAVQSALKALSVETPYAAQAQLALTTALGVYDLSDGLKPHLTIEMPSEALKLDVSKEGTYAAALYAYSVLVADTRTGATVAELPTRATAVSDFCFLGEDRLLYAGETGLCAYDLASRQPLWTGEPVTRLAISEDETLAVGVDGQADRALIYDLNGGQLYKTVSFQGRRQSLPAGGGILADPEDALLALNRDGAWLAVSFEDGGISLYQTESGDEYRILDSSEYTHVEGGFYDHYLAFSAWDDKECIFAIYDLNTMSQTTGCSASTPFFVRTDCEGIYVASQNLLVRFDPVTEEQQELAYTGSDIVSFVRGNTGRVLLTLQDNDFALFNAHAQLITKGQREKGCELIGQGGDYVILASLETPTVQILRLESYPESTICGYDPQNEHIEARLSADGKTAMLFQYDKFFLYSREGVLLTQMDIPDAEQVYDQQYRRENGESWLEVTYYDGMIRAYSAVDGTALWERQGETPDGSLEETFETTRWRIKAPLHEAPMVYDKETGVRYKELEEDSYLTYVTETGEYIVTQYLSAQGEWYGLLLNQELETLAYLPNLCDVMGDTLLFDDGCGNLRQSRIYSMQELKALAQK